MLTGNQTVKLPEANTTPPFFKFFMEKFFGNVHTILAVYYLILNINIFALK